MKLLIQPPGSRLCGQYCVAMLADVAPEASIAVFGKSGPTKPLAVATALNHYGFHAIPQLHRICQHTVLPPLCLLKLSRPRQASFHWVIFQAGTVYCPLLGIVKYEDYLRDYPALKFTSFLEIFTSSQLLAPVKDDCADLR